MIDIICIDAVDVLYFIFSLWVAFCIWSPIYIITLILISKR